MSQSKASCYSDSFVSGRLTGCGLFYHLICLFILLVHFSLPMRIGTGQAVCTVYAKWCCRFVQGGALYLFSTWMRRKGLLRLCGSVTWHISASLNKKKNFSLLSHGISVVQKYHFGKQSSGEPRWAYTVSTDYPPTCPSSSTSVW